MTFAPSLDALDALGALSPANVGLLLLCLLLCGACWGWAHCQSVLTAQLVLSRKHTHYWKTQAQLRPPTLAERSLLQNATASKPPSGVKQTAPHDWDDSALLTQVIVPDIHRAKTLVWHRPVGKSPAPPPLPRTPSGRYSRRKGAP